MKETFNNQGAGRGERGAASDKHLFGFWVYLMTDLIMFAALFAVFAVLRSATFGGPAEAQLINLPGALGETMILLASSFTCGLAMLAVRQAAAGESNKINRAIGWFAVTFVLGATFLALELSEFAGLVASGHGPQASASLSAFFTLVSTHGLHIAIGLLWMIIGIVQLKLRGGSAAGGRFSPSLLSKLDRLAMFWHFLDIVWIFIFTIVYLMGAAL